MTGKQMRDAQRVKALRQSAKAKKSQTAEEEARLLMGGVGLPPDPKK
jgi:hypothetical protein